MKQQQQTMWLYVCVHTFDYIYWSRCANTRLERCRTVVSCWSGEGGACLCVYKCGDEWLIKTDHHDFWEWLRGHEYYPPVKGLLSRPVMSRVI